MATAPNTSSSAATPAQNSPRARQPRRLSAARGVASPPSPSAFPPVPGIVDQEQFLTSSSSTSSDSLPIKEANAVAGEDGAAAAAAAEEDFQLENGENVKKPVWKKPSNGAAVAVEAGGAVMDAELWPALSESARASPKSPLKALAHGSVNVSQELSGVSLSSPKEVSTSISSPNSVSNHVVHSRQKRESVKRGGGNPSQHVSSTDDVSPLAQHAVHDTSSHSSSKFGGPTGEPLKDNKPDKDAAHKVGTYSGNDSQPQQRSFRRNNSGPLTRGDGSYHSSHGGRRDQERGKQDWGHRSFGSRENQRTGGSRPFMRGPAPSASFVPPPPVNVRPYVAPVVYTEMPSPVFYMPGLHPDSLRPISMVPMPSMFFSMHDPQLPSRIMNQIEYYFSNENLVKDTFLRQNMDSEGWVSVKLIAGFKKVMQLTDNIQFILDVIKASNIVEVQGDKVRRKGDWMKWIMSHGQNSIMSPQSVNKSSPNMLAAHLNNVALDEKAAT